MTTTSKFALGDWLLVERNNLPVVGVVMFIRYRDSYPSGWTYLTTIGTVDEDKVIEARAARQETGQ